MTGPNVGVRQQKFRSFFGQHNDYRMFVGVPFDRPDHWEQVYQLEGNVLAGADLRTYALHEIRSWLVAYAGTGEIVDCESLFEPVPEGVTSIISQTRLVLPPFSAADLDHGRSMVKIRFGPSPTHPENPVYYSTALTNISKAKFMCYGFGAYRSTKSGFQLCNVTGVLFSSEQFEEWYGVQRGGWIEPDETVCDPSNYGSNCTWVYHCKTSQGVAFHAGQHHGSLNLGAAIRRFFTPRK